MQTAISDPPTTIMDRRPNDTIDARGKQFGVGRAEAERLEDERTAVVYGVGARHLEEDH